ncbi:MAG: S1 RNA-binding domain-containing protein, partial [Oscillospiraceae bacterium]|nr:S1 RNA-binding domain-containing protein [Oscillospiraceae bacterium]
MGLEVGSIVEGRVTGITKFGAFVALPGGKSGLVHISEVANSFVSDVHDHVQMGQTVKVRILTVGDDGRINLSITRAEEAPAEPPRQEPRHSAPRVSAP